jgi:hypothetical protein
VNRHYFATIYFIQQLGLILKRPGETPGQEKHHDPRSKIQKSSKSQNSNGRAAGMGLGDWNLVLGAFFAFFLLSCRPSFSLATLAGHA